MDPNVNCRVVMEWDRRLLLENEDVGTVFATDAILSTLMCSPRSMYSWDIVVQRVGNKLFFDKRDASFDLLTVSHLPWYFFNLKLSCSLASIMCQLTFSQ